MKRNIFLMADATDGGGTDTQTKNEPKYTPRSAAADFTKGLPKLGVEAEPAPAAIAPAPQPDPPAPAPKPGEPAPAAAAPAEEKMPRTAKDWEAFRAANKKRMEEKEGELTKLQSELKELKEKANPTVVDDARVKAIEKERDELSEKLRLTDIVNHPKFKSYYDGKVNAQIELAKRIVGTEKADAVTRLLALPDNDFRQEQLEAVIATLSPLQQSRFGGVLNTLTEIEADKSSQIERAKTDFVVAQEKSKKETEAKNAGLIKQAETMFTNIVSTVQNPKDKDGMFIFQKRDGDEEWNKGVDARVEYAKNMLFGQHPPETLMKAALNAAALPGVLKSYQLSLARITELEEQVKGLTAAQPAMHQRGGGEGGEKPSGGDKKKSGFLNGRGDAADWIKSTADAQTT